MSWLRKRRSTPAEERRYGHIFVLASVLLTLATGWAVVDEVWVRRPWKTYQKEFYTLELEKAQENLHKAEAKFLSPEVQSKHSTLETQLHSAEAALKSEEYQTAVKELEDLEMQLSELSQELQFVRSESDEVYYLYKTALHKSPPRRAAKEKTQLDKLEREKEKLSQEIASMQQRRSAVEKRVRDFDRRVENLNDSLTTLKADISVWQRKIEAVRHKAIEVKQVVLPDFDNNNFGGKLARVERCVTCHLGVEQPGFENEQQPYTRQSYITEHHTVEKYGCTPCHGGQGVALTVKAAHGEVEFWPNPLLADGARERLCGQCHQEGI